MAGLLIAGWMLSGVAHADSAPISDPAGGSRPAEPLHGTITQTLVEVERASALDLDRVAPVVEPVAPLAADVQRAVAPVTDPLTAPLADTVTRPLVAPVVDQLTDAAGALAVPSTEPSQQAVQRARPDDSRTLNHNPVLPGTGLELGIDAGTSVVPTPPDAAGRSVDTSAPDQPGRPPLRPGPMPDPFPEPWPGPAPLSTSTTGGTCGSTGCPAAVLADPATPHGAGTPTRADLPEVPAIGQHAARPSTSPD